jgi:hypothetical protein
MRVSTRTLRATHALHCRHLPRDVAANARRSQAFINNDNSLQPELSAPHPLVHRSAVTLARLRRLAVLV